MAKVLTITESQMKSLIRLIAEGGRINLDDYNDFDFFDALIGIFRKWLQSKIGDEQSKYPFSYLAEKYKNAFIKDLLGNDAKYYLDVNTEDVFDYWSAKKFITYLIEKGKLKLPSLRDEVKFTEKFKNPIKKFINRLSKPSWVNIEIEEKNPYEILIIIEIDIEPFLRDEVYFSSDNTYKEFVVFFEDYLGVNVKDGNPIYGGLRLNVDVRFKDEEGWEKNVIKKIKKEMRSLDDYRIIKSISFDLSQRGFRFKLIFDRSSTYIKRNEIRNKVKEYLTNSGYKKIRGVEI